MKKYHLFICLHLYNLGFAADFSWQNETEPAFFEENQPSPLYGEHEDGMGESINSSSVAMPQLSEGFFFLPYGNGSGTFLSRENCPEPMNTAFDPYDILLTEALEEQELSPKKNSIDNFNSDTCLESKEPCERRLPLSVDMIKSSLFEFYAFIKCACDGDKGATILNNERMQISNLNQLIKEVHRLVEGRELRDNQGEFESRHYSLTRYLVPRRLKNGVGATISLCFREEFGTLIKAFLPIEIYSSLKTESKSPVFKIKSFKREWPVMQNGSTAWKICENTSTKDYPQKTIQKKYVNPISEKSTGRAKRNKRVTVRKNDEILISDHQWIEKSYKLNETADEIRKKYPIFYAFIECAWKGKGATILDNGDVRVLDLGLWIEETKKDPKYHGSTRSRKKLLGIYFQDGLANGAQAMISSKFRPKLETLVKAFNQQPRSKLTRYVSDQIDHRTQLAAGNTTRRELKLPKI